MSQCYRLIKKFNHTQIRTNKQTHTFTTTMKALSVAETAHIVSLLEAGLSVRKIQSLTGLAISTISRLHSKHLPDSPKSLGGCPSKLSPTNIHYAVHLLSSQKLDTIPQITKALSDITNQPISTLLHKKIFEGSWFKGCGKADEACFETQA